MFNHLRMERQVREAVAQGARIRARAAFWTAASVALAVAGVFLAVMAVGGRTSEDGLTLAALVAFATATPPAVWGYWAWRDVRRRDRQIVDVVSSFAERFVASRVDAPERPAAKGVPPVLARWSVTTQRAAASDQKPLTA
jgi:hypothetical protein